MAKLDLNDNKTVKPTNLLADRVNDLYKKWNPEPAKIPEKEAVSTESKSLIDIGKDLITKPYEPIVDATKKAFNPLKEAVVDPIVDAVKNYDPNASANLSTSTNPTTVNKDVVNTGGSGGGGSEPTPDNDSSGGSVNVVDNVIDSILNNSYNKNASDVYDKFMEIMGEDIKMGDVMSEGEANARARDHYNGTYDKAMEEAMRKIDKNALRSGFYGQLPTEQLKANAAAEIEASKQRDINQHASDLVTDSRDSAQVDYNNALNERNQRANLLSSAVNSYVNLDNNALNRLNTVNNIENDKRDQDRADEKLAFDKSVTEAELTGLYNGVPTMQKEAMDADISQGWTKIANDKAAKEQANASSEAEYKNNVYAKAYEETLDFFKEMYPEATLMEMLEGGNEELMNKFYSQLERYIKNYTNSGSNYSSAYADGWLE